jgi:uncharacterized protein (DUF433 family)
METELLKRITIIPGLMSGKPTIRGLRFPAGDSFKMLAIGMSTEEILEQHPTLEREDIQAALMYAALRTKNTLIINAA